ncbi:MAG: hypothetical protein OEW67_04010 [Cyclobacteriaceae bacterium]|nr:hypothetical protein [Cyclobacteriaceae bacterium]
MIYGRVKKMILGFENGSLAKEKWTHIAHFEMALWYTYHEPIHKARKLIKEGIKNYNLSVGGENTDSSGYHETITELYILIIINYQLSFKNEYDFEILIKELYNQPFIEKTFLFQFYTKDRLMSVEARKKWVDPDVIPIVSI